MPDGRGPCRRHAQSLLHPQPLAKMMQRLNRADRLQLAAMLLVPGYRSALVVAAEVEREMASIWAIVGNDVPKARVDELIAAIERRAAMFEQRPDVAQVHPMLAACRSVRADLAAGIL